MNDKNYEFLTRQLMYTGFPDSMATELKAKMSTGDPAFVLTHQGAIKKDLLSSTLFFKKSKDWDTYFFNSYHVNVKTASSPEGLGQTFYISNKKPEEGQEKYKRDFTLKEAYNLLARADNKEEQRFVYGKWIKKSGETYYAWKGLNLEEKDKNNNYLFRQYHDSFGFKLQKSLSDVPIKDSDKNDPELMRSLQKGNLESLKTSNGEIIYLSAYPPERRINLFDKDMKLMDLKKTKEDLSQADPKSQGIKQEPPKPLLNEKKASLVADPDSSISKWEKTAVRMKARNSGDDMEMTARTRSRSRGR